MIWLTVLLGSISLILGLDRLRIARYNAKPRLRLEWERSASAIQLHVVNLSPSIPALKLVAFGIPSAGIIHDVMTSRESILLESRREFSFEMPVNTQGKLFDRRFEIPECTVDDVQFCMLVTECGIAISMPSPWSGLRPRRAKVSYRNKMVLPG